MMYGIALSFGGLTATIQASGEYDPMTVEDMLNQARAGILELLNALPDDESSEATNTAEAAAGLSHHQAMRRDLLQDDD